MNQFNPDFFQNSLTVFIDPAEKTLQDIRALVAAEPPGTTRRDGLSALDAVVRLANRPLSEIPVTPQSMRRLFAEANPAAVGMSKKRIQNVRSGVMSAIKRHGTSGIPFAHALPVSPHWEALLAKTDDSDYCSALRRFGRFCTAIGVEPHQVSRDVLLPYYDALEAEQWVKRPLITLRLVMTYWNRYMKQVPDWPQVRLTSPFPSRKFRFNLEAFPLSFQHDIEDWRRRMADPDVLDVDMPRKASRPVTVSWRIDSVLRFATALIKIGAVPLADVTSLTVLVQPDNMKPGLRFFMKRSDGKPTGYVRQYGQILLALARHHCKLDPEAIKQVESVVHRLGTNKKGMRPGNIERLKQFDDKTQWPLLLALPFRLRHRAMQQTNPMKRAKLFDQAVMVGILVRCCLRIKNVQYLRLDHNLRRSGRSYFLTFIPPEMKSDRDHELEISPDLGGLLDEYIQTHRPRLPGAQGPYLIPGDDGGPRHNSSIRTAFKKAVWGNLGLKVHPHLNRHIMGTLMVEHDPALLPTVSQYLGHASIQTTMDFYLPNDGRSASRFVNKVMAQELATKKPGKKGRK